MHDPEVPGDLESLADRLAGMNWPAASPGLSGRVLQAVAREQARGQRRSGWAAYASGLAAAVLIMLNLTLQAANQRASLPAAMPAARAERIEQVRNLLPDLSPEEVRALTF